MVAKRITANAKKFKRLGQKDTRDVIAKGESVF
jgi:hypothetical protein